MRYAPVLQWHKQIRVLHCTKARVLCCWSDLFGYVNYFTAFFLELITSPCLLLECTVQLLFIVLIIVAV
jgi:hypothetical protein